MKKMLIAGFGLAVLIVASVGVTPWGQTVDPAVALDAGPGAYVDEIQRQGDGTYMVAARTDMPGASAQMVRWWFATYLQTTEHYKSWHPKDHVWMDWENKVPGEIVGASHLVHEYIGPELQKLRIQFVDPAEFFGTDPNTPDRFVICARTGDLEMPYNLGKMCHIVVNTENGAEMRSRFWLGHVEKRDGNDTVPSIEGVIGNMALVRYFAVSEGFAHALMVHAQTEMSILGKLLPGIYPG